MMAVNFSNFSIRLCLPILLIVLIYSTFTLGIQLFDTEDEILQGKIDLPKKISKRQSTTDCQIPLEKPGTHYKVMCSEGAQDPTCRLKPGDHVPTYTTISVSCDDGYMYDGNTNLPLFCALGVWSPKVESCKKTCLIPDTENTVLSCYNNGKRINCDSNIKPGIRIQASCLVGYVPDKSSGSEEILCLESGEWDRRPINCVSESSIRPATTKKPQPKPTPAPRPTQQPLPSGGDLTPDSIWCLTCICEAISSCNSSVSGCEGDVCGLYRITWAYWADAGKLVIGKDDPNTPAAYRRCTTDLICARSTVAEYIKRYSQDCNNDGVIDCYDYGAIHYLGGYNCRDQLDPGYAQKLRSCTKLRSG